MPAFSVIDNRTGQPVATFATYGEARDYANRDRSNLYVTHVYRPGEVRL